MTTTPALRPSPLPTNRLAVNGAVLAAFAVTVMTALVAGNAAGGRAVVLPLALCGALALAGIAIARFAVFVMVILLLRSALDLFRISEGTTASRMFNPSTILAVLFLLASVFWLLAQRRQWNLAGSPLRYTLAAFVFAALTSALTAHNQVSVLVEALRISAAVMVFVVVELLARSPERMRQLLGAAFASTLIPIAAVGFSALTGTTRAVERGGLTRVTGAFHQPNLFGRYLMLFVVMAIALYPAVRPPLRRAIVAFVVVAGTCILLTYTRSAIVGAVLGVFVVGLFGRKRVAAGVVVVTIATLLFVPSVGSRFGELTSPSPDAYSTHANSLQWRFSYWAEVLPLADENRLTGIGVGQTASRSVRGVEPHNDLVRAYVETGLFGLVTYLGMLAGLVLLGLRAVRSAPRGSLDHAVAVGFVGTTVALVTASAFANVFSNVVTLSYYFTFAAAAAAVVWRSEHTRAYAPAPAAGTGGEPVR